MSEPAEFQGFPLFQPTKCQAKGCQNDVKVLERLAFLIQGRENGIRAALNSTAGEKEGKL